MRCSSDVHGNGIVYLTKMSYDTGCSSIFIHENEDPFIIPFNPMSTLNYTSVYTAVGQVHQPIPTLPARVLDPTYTGVIWDWHSMNGLSSVHPKKLVPNL